MANIQIETESFSKHDVARIDGTFTQVQNQPVPAVQPVEFNLDNYPGYTFRAKPILDLDGVIAQIDSGEAQKITANNTITYTFLKEGQDLISIYNNPNYDFTSGYGLSAFRPDQIAFARKAIGLWDDLIAPSFREVNGRGADIQFANSWDPAQAYAYTPAAISTSRATWSSKATTRTPTCRWADRGRRRSSMSSATRSGCRTRATTITIPTCR